MRIEQEQLITGILNKCNNNIAHFDFQNKLFSYAQKANKLHIIFLYGRLSNIPYRHHRKRKELRQSIADLIRY